MKIRSSPLTRVFAYVCFASLVCAALGARVVYADLREGTLQAGRELATLGDVLGTTKTLFLNGAVVNVSNALTTDSPKAVLDRFERVCREHPLFLARALEDLPAELQDELGRQIPDESVRGGVLRAEANGDGALTCFMDDRPSSLRDLPGRLRAFSSSYDLSEFGRVRYVYATRIDAGSTRVTTVWADGSLKLKEMFPAKGDAAGEDTTVVPRPPSARRILSAAAAQVPFGVYIYDAALNEASLRTYYDDQMKSLGWTRVTPDPRTKSAQNTVVYMAGTSQMLYVTLATPRSGSTRHTIVTVTQSSRTGSPGEVVVRVPN
jgi:hypothetical protein